jgi:L-rhamnose mutarotase
MRKALLMRLKPGCEAEYEKRHNPIWPELESVLRQHGVSNYSIFHEAGSDRLFAYAEIESDELWKSIAQTEICQRWWSSMSELMLTNADHSPQASALREVFHID